MTNYSFTFHKSLWVAGAIVIFTAGVINAGNAHMAQQKAIINFVFVPSDNKKDSHEVQPIEALTNLKVRSGV